MTLTNNWRQPEFWRAIASIAGLLTVGIGVLVLFGWWMEIVWLKSLSPNWVSMKVNTAIGFICAGSALWLKTSGSTSATRSANIAANFLSGIVVLIGALSLFEYLSGLNLYIDQLFFTAATDTIGTLAPGRMAPASALVFMFAGAALLLDLTSARHGKAVSVLALLIAFTALAGGLIYLYDTDNSYGLGYGLQFAGHTIAAFLLLAGGLFCAQAEYGIVALIRSFDIGGTLVRRLLPAAILAPIAIGWLKLFGERLELYEPDFGVALVALAYVLTLSMLVVWVARFRSRAEAERELSNAATVASEARLRTLLRTIPDLIWMKDPQGFYLACNAQFERFVGAKEADLIGKTDYDFASVSKEQADFFRANDRAAIAAGRATTNEEWITLADSGERILAETRKAPVVDEHGQLLGVLGIARDITFRQKAVDLTHQAQLETEHLLVESNQSRRALLGVLEDSKTATEALRQSEEKLRVLNEELERRVAERTAQLQAVNQELEAFSYSVSHDLRAPLRSISGFVELLKKHNYDNIDDKGRHYMEVIADSAVKMGQLIDDILTFSRIGRAAMQPSKVSLDQLVAEIMNTLRPQFEGRQIEWKIHSLPEVLGERTMLSLVLLNLITNALKFTQTREVAVIEIGTLADSADENVCFIKDNGVGFDMQYANKLFGLFQRLHTQEQFEGTGVGLANVQRIIQRHNGRVWADSTVNGGATFYFALPKQEGG